MLLDTVVDIDGLEPDTGASTGRSALAGPVRLAKRLANGIGMYRPWPLAVWQISQATRSAMQLGFGHAGGLWGADTGSLQLAARMLELDGSRGGLI
jgi:hypothetical protein